jgi:outer membrane protein assembly factor BamB
MKKTLIAIALLLATKTYSQVTPEWKTPVEGTPSSIYFHNFTQTPIVETSKFYYGVNPTDKKITWTIKKSDAMAAMQAARTASALSGSDDVTQGMNLEQYYEIPYTQFANINNNIVDISSGAIILGEGNNPIKALNSNHIIPELNILLLNVKDADGSTKLYALDIASSKILWGTKLAEASATKDALKFVEKGFVVKIDLFTPAINGSKDIVYNNNGKLTLINSKTGAIIWENDCNPGTFFLNEDQTKIIVINRPSSLSSMAVPKPFGKKVMAIDAATGKNLWAEQVELEGTYKMYKFLSKNEVLLAYNNGINLYDITSGKKMWKKDFETPNLKTVDDAKEGLGLQYGNKIMVINPKTGQKVWKKPIELEGVDENAEYEPLSKVYPNSLVIVAPEYISAYDKATGKRKWSKGIDKGARVGFDDSNNKILVVSKKQVFLFNPDNQTKAPKAIDVKIENPEEIVGYEVKPNGYFIFGQKEYMLVSKEGELVTSKVFNQLKGKRGANAALLAASIASGVMGAEVTTTSGDGQESTSGLFVDAETAKGFQEMSAKQSEFRNQLKDNDKQRRAVRSDENNAYFVKGENANNATVISMVVVEKNSGKEVKTIDFSSDRDVVFEIDFNNGMLYYIEKGEFSTVKL